MKKFILILLVYLISMYGLTLRYQLNTPETIYSGLDTLTAFTWKARLDSIADNLTALHTNRTGVHVVTDSTTEKASILDCTTTWKTARSLNNIRTQLIAHMAVDSSHVGACIDTTVPDAIDEQSTYPEIVTYADTLLLSYDAHFADTYNNRYDYIAALLDSAIIIHCAKDTSDASDVHFFPDTVYTTAAYDSTNIDSTYAGYIRLANRWNTHVLNEYWHNTSTNDTIVTALMTPTTIYGVQQLSNALLSAYNKHVATYKGSIGYPEGEAAHWKADTNLITAEGTEYGGHLIADTGGSSKAQAYQEYLMPYYDEDIISVTGSSVSSGADFYIYASVSGSDYSLVDSVNVTTNGTTLKTLTTWYPYVRVTCSSYTDGEYEVIMKGGK